MASDPGALTAIASISIVVAGYAASHYLGLPVPWPWHLERPQPAAPGAMAPVPEQKAKRSPALLDDIVIRRSNQAGGTGGEPFDEKNVNMQAAPVTGLVVTVARSVADQQQKLIASVQAHWSDVSGPVHGGAGGAVIINPETRSIRFDNDEAVRQLIIFHRRFNWPDPANAPVWVSGIQVRTSKSTYTFGDVDGSATECTLGKTEQIIGFFGRAGAYVDALGCLIR
jgi:Jacalin-like lectin domain